MWIVASIAAAIVAGIGIVAVLARWTPRRLGYLPHVTVCCAALLIVLGIGYGQIDGDVGLQQRLIEAVHVTLGVMIVAWWWLNLRLLDIHGHALPIPLSISHGVVPAVVTLTALPAVLGLSDSFLSFYGDGAYELHAGWFAFIGCVLVLAAIIAGIALYRAVTSELADDRWQYLCIFGATVIPGVGGFAAVLTGLPIDILLLSYGIAVALMVIGIYRGQMFAGLGPAFDQVLATDPNATFLVDRNQRLLYVNTAGLTLFGDSCRLGVDVSAWMSARVTYRSGEPFSLAVTDVDEPYRLVKCDTQEDRLYAVAVRRIHGNTKGSGAVIGQVITFRDETINEKYRQAALAARRIESLSHMAGGVAHRFNNLLVAVVGNVDIAKYEVEAEERNHQYLRDVLDDIQTAGEQAAELAKQLVTFSGHQVGEVQRFELNTAIQDALDLVGERLSPTVECDVAFASTPLMIDGDRAQITEVVLGLLINASEAYGERRGTIRISTGFRSVAEDDLAEVFNRQNMAPGEYAYLQVADHAGGLSPEVREHLFEPFITSKTTGQGLGLSTVLGTAIAHQGGVGVNNVDNGTVFTVYIPRLDVASTQVSSVTVAPVHRETILVVDDNEEVLNVQTAMLESLGQSVVATRSPHRALELARMHRFQLALIDVAMPEMRGNVLAEEIRKTDPELPVVLVSGFAEGQLVSTENERNTIFLEKPFGVQALWEAIERVSVKPKSKADVVSLKRIPEP